MVENPRPLKKQTKKPATAQRSLCRKKKGSRNREKQRIKLARVHERIANIRLDFLHKLTTLLCRENQTIAVESLNIKGMLKNHKLARAISDVSWGEFFRQLDYKSLLYGCTVLRVPTMYPSSQTCSECGYKNPLVKDLKVREWDCPQCGAHHNRDFNAAINILNKATVGHTESYACGERVRRNQGAVFEEARIPNEECQRSVADYMIARNPALTVPNDRPFGKARIDKFACAVKIDGADTIKVAVTGDLPPLDLITAEGKPAGFNTAVLSEISKRINKNIELVSIECHACAAALSSGNIDVVFWVRVPQSDDTYPIDFDRPDGIAVSESYFQDESVHVGKK